MGTKLSKVAHRWEKVKSHVLEITESVLLHLEPFAAADDNEFSNSCETLRSLISSLYMMIYLVRLISASICDLLYIPLDRSRYVSLS